MKTFELEQYGTMEPFFKDHPNNQARAVLKEGRPLSLHENIKRKVLKKINFKGSYRVWVIKFPDPNAAFPGQHGRTVMNDSNKYAYVCSTQHSTSKGK